MVPSVASARVNRSEVHRDQLRAQRLLEMEIEFIPSDEFEGMLAANVSLQQFESAAMPRRARKRGTMADEQPLACLAPALNEPLLSFAEEQHEFRRMNYLKFVAAQLRSTLNASRPSRKKMAQIEQALAEARQAREHLIRTNLRLVVSNAGKYSSSVYGFEDLVSDGSLALMEAVDKFDYGRGFRFSTYATHAIRRSFFRKMERRQKDRQRFVVTDPELMTSTADDFEVDFDAPAENRLAGQLARSLDEHLTERERHVVEGRFGLNGRGEPQTLMELSGELGICKERVRQVEGIALKKLQAAAVHYAKSRPDVLEVVPG
jgi:RNA polymerase sigma factor (sigma-70 family)